jgi:hypothetical protein
MKNDKRTEYVTRDSILKLLSSEEIASVSTAETAEVLANGEEYLDLEYLSRGIQHAHGRGVPMQQILSRKAVHENTWAKIVTQLKDGDLNAALP